MSIGPYAEFGTISGDRVYKVEEIARDVWECSERTVRDAIRDPIDPLPAFNVGRGRERSDLRILESELLAWMKRQQTRTMNRNREGAPTRNSSHPTTEAATPCDNGFKARRAARKSSSRG
jgi:hypothetical protein